MEVRSPGSWVRGLWSKVHGLKSKVYCRGLKVEGGGHRRGQQSAVSGQPGDGFQVVHG